jgi:mono/diheme cytochrome c family protein
MIIKNLARTIIVWALLFTVLLPTSWANSSGSSATDQKTHKSVDINRGKTIYLSNCIACHNKDPNKKGSLGPELVGSPIEVFKTKILTGSQYPEGYAPKRKTKIMKKLPKLENEIPNIYAWIQSVAAPATK